MFQNTDDAAVEMKAESIFLDGEPLSQERLLWFRCDPVSIPSMGVGSVRARLQDGAAIPKQIAMRCDTEKLDACAISNAVGKCAFEEIRFDGGDPAGALVYFANNGPESCEITLEWAFPELQVGTRRRIEIPSGEMGVLVFRFASALSAGAPYAVIVRDEKQRRCAVVGRRPPPFTVASESAVSQEACALLGLRERPLGDPIMVCPTHRFGPQQNALRILMERWVAKPPDERARLCYVHPCRAAMDKGILVFGDFGDMCRINASVGYLLALQGRLPEQSLEHPVAVLMRLQREACRFAVSHAVVSLKDLWKESGWTDRLVLRETVFHAVAEGAQAILYRGAGSGRLPKGLQDTVSGVNTSLGHLAPFLTIGCPGWPARVVRPDVTAQASLCGDHHLLVFVFCETTPSNDPVLGYVRRTPVRDVAVAVPLPRGFRLTEALNMTARVRQTRFVIHGASPEGSGRDVVTIVLDQLDQPQVFLFRGEAVAASGIVER